jgi:predicted nucleic acid-binding protein
VACEAKALITGDGDLLSLHPFRGVPILMASDFIKQFIVA